MTFDLNNTVQILSGTPEVLRSLLKNVPDTWTRTSSDPGSWSPFDVVGHLIHGEETDWIPRAKIILDQGENKSFVPFDRFAQFEHSMGKSLADLLDEFETRRRESLETLRSWHLTAEQLSLSGVHPEFGSVTLRQLLATWPVHDLTHIRQIATGIAKQFEPEVGPWKAYTSILQ